MPTLILPARYTSDSVALWRSALARGWNVKRISGPSCPPVVDRPVLYLDGMLGELVARQLGLAMVSPPLDWLIGLPDVYRRRRIRLLPWKDARSCPGPAFFKPADDKWFAARIYSRGADIEVDPEFDPEAPVLISEPVCFEVEFRFFVVDRRVLTGSSYARDGQAAFGEEIPPEARRLIEDLVADPTVSLVRSLVVDVGRTREHGWVVVEANPAWASGLYDCDPDLALEAIAACSGPS